VKRFKIVFTIILLLGVSLSTSGCTRAFQNVLGIQPDAKGTPVLETLKPRHAGFEVSMPGPRDEVATEDMMKRNYVYKHTDGTYSMSYGLVHGSLMDPAQIQAALDENCDKQIQSIGGKQTASKAIEYYGGGCEGAVTRIGKEVEGTLDTDRTFKLRAYIIGSNSFKTSYSLIVFGKKPFVNSNEANLFISSLKMLK
jgi:hypothetical protein